MYFQFTPAVQAAIDAGKYVQVFTSTGVPIGLARDPVTGKFVAHAIGALINNSPLSPLVAASQFAMGAAQMYQTHQGFTAVQAGLQTLQTSVGVLQATTSVIGVGVAAGVALSAVNLYQMLKLRQAVERLEVKVENGFINLEQALKDQGAEIKQLILEVTQDIKFEQHRIVLVRAYGLFTQALQRLQIALKLQDTNRRNAEIDAARGMLFEALADYTNPHLLEETCAAGQLRRLECAWAIDQTIIATYQVQNELAAASDRLSYLQGKIRQDALTIIERCESEDELDFLFPEITRIYNHDLALLNSWQNHNDWMRSLSPKESELLLSSGFIHPELTTSKDTNEATTVAAPSEQLLYENLKQKSHSLSLQLQMQFMMSPQLRLEYESYISQQAVSTGYKTLVSSNLQPASDLAVANLYYYFKIRDESEENTAVI
jgi:hypothetical protein